MVSYYDRTPHRMPDGSMSFKASEDTAAEDAASAILERAWGCRLHKYAKMSQVDWWAEQDNRVVGFVELKSRRHSHDKFPTVLLNVRKYMALLNWSMHTAGCWGRYAVLFEDGLRWVDVARCCGLRPVVGGCSRHVKSRNDIEPVIQIPVEWMEYVK